MGLGIDAINRCDEARFVDLLGGIYEHSPWVAELVFDRRPFASRAALHEVMAAEMRRAPRLQRMALLCAHPELAGREAQTDGLTRESRREQRGAGLDQCSPQELDRIRSLNRAYREKFEFPFIIAVTGLDRHDIIAAMERRLANPPEDEFETALDEVEKIARIRLEALLDD